MEADGVTLDGLVIRNADSAIEPGDGVACTGIDLTVRSCSLLHNAGVGVRSIDGTSLIKSVFSGNSIAALVIGDQVTVKKCEVRGDCERGFTVIGANATVVDNELSSIEDGRGVEVIGNFARVADNELSGVDATAIYVEGDDAELSGNDVSRTINLVIEVVGMRASLTGNTILRGDDGIVITGDDATVEKNVIDACVGNGVTVEGDAASVSKNTVRFAGGVGLVVNGASAEVAKNEIGDSIRHGVHVVGDMALVDKNIVRGVGECGIEVIGDTPTITDNTIEHAVDDAVGLSVLGAQNGGLVQGNEISDAMCNGLFVGPTSAFLEVRGNLVLRCGIEEESGFLVLGDDHLVEDNVAKDGGGDGFTVTGDRVTLRGNTAKKNLLDGFDIDSPFADDTVLEGNKAIKNGAEGIENNGANTVIRDNKGTGNRIDFANDGTVVEFTGNTSGDGSDAATPPEMDT